MSPEIIDFTDLPWNKSGTIESEKMIINSLSGNAGVTQMGKLQDGQLAIMKFREEFTDGANGDIIFMPIFLLTQTATQRVLYGSAVINDGRVLFLSGTGKSSIIGSPINTVSITITCFLKEDFLNKE